MTAMDAAVAVQPLTNPPGGETDHLAAAVLRSLGRSFRNQFSVSPAQAFWFGLISFGLWPLLRMGRQFRDYVTFERQQLWHLTEWVRLRRGGEDSQALQSQLKAIRPRALIRFLIAACIAATIFAALRDLQGDVSLNRLIDHTYRLHRPWSDYGPTPLWKAWVVMLGAAYALHAVRVVLHHHRVARFVSRFNAVLSREGVAAVSMPEMDADLQSGWWWTAGILAWFGALWAIPMALAGATHRRYINGTSARLRAEMLERVRAMLAQRRPPVAVPNFVIHSRRCGNPLCRATLRADAKFCTRCGTSAAMMSEVA